MRRHTVLLVVTLLTGLASMFSIQPAAIADIHYVDGENGSDGNGGLTWGAAKKTISAAITDATSGDQIWVRGREGSFSGVYAERITLTEGVALYGGLALNGSLPTRGSHPPFNSEQWPNETIIDGSAGGYVVTVPSAATTATIIDGFTIRNGTNGVYSPSASPTVTHNRIESNNGTGVYTSSGGPQVKYNVIQHNSYYGVYCGTYATATIAYNTVRGNGYGGSYGGVYSSAGTCVAGNFVSGNTVYGIYTSGSVAVTHNTIVSNGGFLGALYNTAGSPTITSNIVAFNESGVYHAGSGTPAMSYN